MINCYHVNPFTWIHMGLLGLCHLSLQRLWNIWLSLRINYNQICIPSGHSKPMTVPKHVYHMGRATSYFRVQPCVKYHITYLPCPWTCHHLFWWVYHCGNLQTHMIQKILKNNVSWIIWLGWVDYSNQIFWDVHMIL